MASPERPKRGLQPADRIALVAVCGIALSALVWIAFAAVDAMVYTEISFDQQLFEPDARQAGVRLGAVVLVLVATLIAQMLYSSRLRVEEQLHLEQQRIQQMYDHSPDAMICMDADMRVVYANPASQELAGMPPSGAAGAACHSAIWGLDQPCEGCPLPSVRENLAMRDRTICDDFNGFERWLQQIIYPVFDESGGIDTFIEVVRDTTRLHLAEEELRVSRRELERQAARREPETAEV